MQAAVVADLAVAAELDELTRPRFEEASEQGYLVNSASGKYHMPYTDKASTVIKNRAKVAGVTVMLNHLLPPLSLAVTPL